MVRLIDRDTQKNLSVHLSNLDESDYEDEDDSSMAMAKEEDILFVNPAEEPKMRLYRSEEFKKFLKGYLLHKHNITREKVTNKYSEKVYRSMFDKNISASKSINLYEKIMYHPDVTEFDYKYIRAKMDNFPKYVLYNQIGCFLVMSMIFYKTPLGPFVRENAHIGAMMLGAIPISVLLGTQKLNNYLLNKRMKTMGLTNKYNVSDRPILF